MATRSSALRILLSAFEESGSCFVLGAGASTPIVPLAAQLGAHVRKRLLAVGSFPAKPILRDAVSDRILGPVRTTFDLNDDGSSVQDELVARHLSPAAVRAAAVAVLRPEAPMYAPHQYQVFNIAKYRLSLINFNNDGLADRYCRQHIVVNVHGTSLSVDDRARFDWERVINTLQEFDALRGIEIPGLLLPQREPTGIALTPAYLVAQRLLRAARRLVLVGYSFGDMDDMVAYGLVTSTIRLRRTVTVVAKPHATDLALRIAEDSGSLTVSGLSVYWDKLASAIIASLAQPRQKSCDHRRLCPRCVAYYYDAFLNAVVNLDYLSRPRNR